MPKAAFYAVARGHAPGVYSTWADCQQQTMGYSNARYKKFNTLREAEAFIRDNAPGASRGSTSIGPGQRNAAPTERTIAVYSASSGSGRASRLVSAAPFPSLKNKKKSPYEDVPPHEEHRWQIVCTDGACSNNGKESAASGLGVWFGRDDTRNISERCPGDQTNNRAELIAIIRALETIPLGGKPLLIKTDSAYCMQCVYEWLPKWEMTKKFVTSKGLPPKNLDLIRYLSRLMTLRDLHSRGSVRLQHVEGHSSFAGNNGADRLAGMGCSLPPRTVSEQLWHDKTAWVEEEINAILASRSRRHEELVAAKPGANQEEDEEPALLPDDEVYDDGPETTEDFPDDYKWMDDITAD